MSLILPRGTADDAMVRPSHQGLARSRSQTPVSACPRKLVAVCWAVVCDGTRAAAIVLPATAPAEKELASMEGHHSNSMHCNALHRDDAHARRKQEQAGQRRPQKLRCRHRNARGLDLATAAWPQWASANACTRAVSHFVQCENEERHLCSPISCLQTYTIRRKSGPHSPLQRTRGVSHRIRLGSANFSVSTVAVRLLSHSLIPPTQLP
jgi:hypothetical protein